MATNDLKSPHAVTRRRATLDLLSGQDPALCLTALSATGWTCPTLISLITCTLDRRIDFTTIPPMDANALRAISKRRMWLIVDSDKASHAAELLIANPHILTVKVAPSLELADIGAAYRDACAALDLHTKDATDPASASEHIWNSRKNAACPASTAALGIRLKQRREQLELSLEACAVRLGYQRSRLADLEQCRRNLSVGQLRELIALTNPLLNHEQPWGTVFDLNTAPQQAPEPGMSRAVEKVVAYADLLGFDLAELLG